MEVDIPSELSRAVLFANGLVGDYGRLRPWVSSGNYLVGVNGGTRHCLEMGFTPDVIIGDLDSLGRESQVELGKQAVPIHRFPARKAHTDLDLAMLHVVEKGIREAVLVGIWGGRLDQSIANLLLLTRYREDLEITIVTEGETAQILMTGNSLSIVDSEGATTSILPLSAQVEGVTITGMEYPLENALLHFGTTLGISNLVKQKKATVSIRRGLLLVIVTRTD